MQKFLAWACPQDKYEGLATLFLFVALMLAYHYAPQRWWLTVGMIIGILYSYIWQIRRIRTYAYFEEFVTRCRNGDGSVLIREESSPE